MAHHRDEGQMPANRYIPDNRGLGRPVDRSQERYEPSHLGPRRTLPHGDVTRDGAHAWPRPSMTSRVLVYGGAALAAAAVTAGTVLAVRKVADLVTGNDELDRDADRAAEQARERVYDASRGRAAAPRFAAMSDRDREAMRARARARAEEDQRERDRMRAEARGAHADRPSDYPRRPPPPRKSSNPLGILGDIEHTAQTLTRNVNDVVGTIGAAMTAFRAVASQAEGVVREFSGTADQIRSFLGAERSAPAPRRTNDGFRRPARRDMVDLRETGADAADEARTHRL